MNSIKKFREKGGYWWKIILIVLVIVVIIVVWKLTTKPYYPPMIASPYEPCDNDRDGDCDKADYELVTQAIGNCEYGEGYNELADADHDGCVTESDREQLFPIIPTE